MGEVIAFPRPGAAQPPGRAMQKAGRLLNEAVALLDRSEPCSRRGPDVGPDFTLGRYERPPADGPLRSDVRSRWKRRRYDQMGRYRAAVLVLEVEQTRRQEHNARHGRQPWRETHAEKAARAVMTEEALELMRILAPHMIALAWKRRHRGHFGHQDEVDALIAADEAWMVKRYASYSRVRACRQRLPGSAGHG